MTGVVSQYNAPPSIHPSMPSSRTYCPLIGHTCTITQHSECWMPPCFMPIRTYLGIPGPSSEGRAVGMEQAWSRLEEEHPWEPVPGS